MISFYQVFPTCLYCNNQILSNKNAIEQFTPYTKIKNSHIFKEPKPRQSLQTCHNCKTLYCFQQSFLDNWQLIYMDSFINDSFYVHTNIPPLRTLSACIKELPTNLKQSNIHYQEILLPTYYTLYSSIDKIHKKVNLLIPFM